MLSYFTPYKHIVRERKKKSDEYEKKWGGIINDKRHVHFLTPKTALHWISMQAKATESMKSIKLPIITFLGTVDEVVNNEITLELLKLNKNSKSKVVNLEGADHTTSAFETPHASRIIRESYKFLDTIVACEASKKCK